MEGIEIKFNIRWLRSENAAKKNSLFSKMPKEKNYFQFFASYLPPGLADLETNYLTVKKQWVSTFCPRFAIHFCEVHFFLCFGIFCLQCLIS